MRWEIGDRGSGMRAWSITYHFLLITFCFLLLSGCTSVAPVVKIGLIGPFEGPQRAIGYDVIYSARLAVREINEAGGIKGTRVALVALDDSGDLELARETAVSLTIDPAVVAVVGNWQPQTTAVAAAVFAEAGMPFIAMGDAPFGESEPAAYPAEFVAAYTAVAPFDEPPGAYAGSAYDAMQLLRAAFAAASASGEPSRSAVADALAEVQVPALNGGAIHLP